MLLLHYIFMKVSVTFLFIADEVNQSIIIRSALSALGARFVCDF